MASKFNPPALQSQTSASNTEPAPAPKKLDLASKFGPASKGSDGADTDGSSSDKPAAAVTGRVPGKLGGGLAGGLAIPMHLPGMGPPPGLAKKLAPSPGTDFHLCAIAPRARVPKRLWHTSAIVQTPSGGTAFAAAQCFGAGTAAADTTVASGGLKISSGNDEPDKLDHVNLRSVVATHPYTHPPDIVLRTGRTVCNIRDATESLPTAGSDRIARQLTRACNSAHVQLRYGLHAVRCSTAMHHRACGAGGPMQ